MAATVPSRCVPLLVATAVIVAACGSGSTVHTRHKRHTPATPAPTRSVRSRSRRAPARPQAVVTDEQQNRVLLVDLPSGRVARSVMLPADPEDIAAAGNGGRVVVVSSRTGEVTVLDRNPLRPIKAFGGFDAPHIVEITPDGRYAYVTDDARGTLTVIRLSDPRLTSTISVGAGAHHLTFSPDQRQAWVALGESASQISILDTTDAADPRLIGRFGPRFPVHDLSFSPDGREVWIGSTAGPDVSVFAAASHRLLFRVPVGAPPQHLTLAGRYAYLTSGYGSTIEQVDVSTGRVIRRARAPYGSFELAAADGYVATASLLRGTLAVYTPGLRLLRVTTLAPATREVVITRPR
jgi:DNA-binding beta-propeller fold protein YncE